MSFLQSIDVWLFRFINGTLQNAFFDRIMPWFSGNVVFFPALVLLAVGLLWKGGARGRLFVGLFALVVLMGDTLLIGPLKEALARPRPFLTLEGVHLLVGRGGSGSFPSSHASTWFAATVVTLVYYPAIWHWVFLTACLVCTSRVYVGVHYPSDVVGGAILGAGYALAILWIAEHGWIRIAGRWLPDLAERRPSLVRWPEKPSDDELSGNISTPPALVLPLSESTWSRLATALILGLFLFRIVFLASSKLELSEDEAYQWLWSKHPALSYFSKPPLITWLHTIGTSLWGDTAFGVRFCAPCISALLSWLVIRFMTGFIGARSAFVLLVLMNLAPLLAVGSILITVDPPMVLFWTAAMVTGWRAIQPGGRTSDWCYTGLWIGLSALSKYAGLYQLVSWALLFCIWPSARPHLRKPGPWLGLLIALASLLPVYIWNSQHGWATVDHVKFNASRAEPWRPTLRFFWDFLGSQSVLLNPILFASLIPAILGFRRIRTYPHLARFLACMGCPVFVGYLFFTFYKRVFPNWIAPSIIPLFCLAALFYHDAFVRGSRWPKYLMVAALSLGLPLVIVLHDTHLIGKITGRPLSVKYDPLRRVRGWNDLAQRVESERQKLLAEGKETFLIAGHYGIAGQLSFYIPAAKQSVPGTALVYYKTSVHPQNQFYFWPGYREQRRGQNALYVHEVDPEDDTDPAAVPKGEAPPDSITSEFRSVKSVAIFPVRHRNQTVRWIQVHACYDLL